MARLEIPSIVVHKGCRSPSRPSSPPGITSSVMPTLPPSKHAKFFTSGSVSNLTYTNKTNQEMIEGNVNASVDNHSSTNDIIDHQEENLPNKSNPEINNYRNRANTKVKLLVRSHAMRESASPPREAHNNHSISPRAMSEPPTEMKFNSGNFSPNSSSSKLNNNESIHNSNLENQFSKQTRTTATSPPCLTSPRNGQLSPGSSSNSSNSLTNIREKPDINQRSKATSPHQPLKCNNCAKNNQNDRPGLLQTPPSPSKSNQHNIQHSPKNSNINNSQNCQIRSEQQRRQNSHSICNNCTNQCSGNTLTVRSTSRHKLRHQNSSTNSGSLDSNVSSCLSRDSSTELYTDSTGIDLEQFISVTINRNQKDRAALLKFEKELIEFVRDRQKLNYRFQNMSSYNRMLVHRVSAYFGLEHNVDHTGTSVVVTRTKNTRIPNTPFKEHLRGDFSLTEEPRRSILKRDSSSFEDVYHYKSLDRMSGDYCRRSKSFEEREEEYEKARRRIFKDSNGKDTEVPNWPYWSSSDSCENSGKYRLLHPGDHNSIVRHRLIKGESCDGQEKFHNVLRPSVSKSFSFGGYTRGMLSRGDSVSSSRSAGARLIKQDSGTSVCSRLSPSSSGYKSQSQRSDATISPSPSPSPISVVPCNHDQPSSQITCQDTSSQGDQTVMWAVSSISSVPPGSIIINPRTNQPCTNADGSIYRFDPENPPKIFSDITEIGESPTENFNDLPDLHDESSRNQISSKPISNKRNNSQKNIFNSTRVMNTATSPTLPCSTSSSELPSPECQPQTIVKPVEISGCTQGRVVNHNYGGYNHQGGSEIVYGQPPIYQGAQSQEIVMQRHQEIQNQQPPPPPPPPPHQQHQQQQQAPSEMMINQGNIYGNYPTMPMQPPPPPPPPSSSSLPPQCHPQTAGEVSDLSGYFMGMNVYEQPRSGSEGAQTTPTHAYNGPPPPPNHGGQNGQYWQPPHPPPPPPHQQNQHNQQNNQIPPQQTMYFVPPSGPPLGVGQPNNDRQNIHQRFTSGYSYNPQTMTPPNQNTPNYVNGYPISYNSMPPNPPDYSYQNQMHMIPTYYPTGQPGIQPPPVMWKVPTPPNTPTSSQMSGVPVMYMNSGNYPPPPVMTAGSYNHQHPSPASSAPPGPAFMPPSVLPNIVFRQNMMGNGMRASTPSGSQRTSRSPTPAHDVFNNNNNFNGNGANGNCNGGIGNGENRNAQAQSRYPLPMYQGLHIVPGDIRLMHPGMPGNPRMPYGPVSSPPVIQGCPRPFRPPYSGNPSGYPNQNYYDGRNQRMRKQRSKVTTLPPTGARSNVNQVPSMPSKSSNPPKDMPEGIVKVKISHRNKTVHF